MFDFTDQVIIVTGSASPRGIGKAIALEFAKQGGNVVIADMDEQGIQKNVADVEAVGGSAMGIPLDITSKASCDAMVQAVMDKWGRIDVLVNNAGLSQKVTVADLTMEDMRRIFDVNVFGLFLCTQSCLVPMRKARYGRIISLSSVAGKRGGGFFGGAHYSASKAAVLGFSKNLAREVATEGITANCVCPGLTNTDIWKSLTKAEAEQAIAAIPMGRPGEPTEIAHTIMFLASKEASYVTGEEIDINGGSHMD